MATFSGAVTRLRATLRRLVTALYRDVLTVWFLARDVRTPCLPRIAAMLVAAYALSPIDLIPDIIPVLGLLDELIVVPLGLAAVLRLTPAAPLSAARERASRHNKRPVERGGAVLVIAVWCLAGWWLTLLGMQYFAAAA